MTAVRRAGLDLLMADEGSYEAMDYVFPNRITLLRDLAAAGVQVLTGCAVQAVEAAGVRVAGPGGDQVLPADTVVAAFGVRADAGLVDALTAVRKVHAVGDCVHPTKVGDAINAAFEVAFAL